MAFDGKVFNIGFNKAGTSSLAVALNRLGIPTLHHKLQGKRLYEIIRANQARGAKLLHGVEHYRGFSDFAGQLFFRLLDRQYPDSRFIVTNRELEAWLDSREAHVRRNLARPHYWGDFRTIDRPRWTRRREEHLAAVRQHFATRPEALLILDIPGGDGWNELCSFLELPIPDEPFPRENVSADEYR